MASRKPDGYWKDWDNMEREAREAIELNDGERPTQGWLRKNGYGGLLNGIKKYYIDGLPAILNRVMEEESGKKPHGYWKEWENMEKEAREAIELNDGNRPTQIWLSKNRYSSLANAANSYHDGLPAVLDRVMGEISKTKPRGYWLVWENMEMEIREAIELNNGNRPTYGWLIKNGYGSLVTAANSYHDGFTNTLDRVMGAEPDKLELFLKVYADGGNGDGK